MVKKYGLIAALISAVLIVSVIVHRAIYSPIKLLFSKSDYVQYSYKIAPGPLSPQSVKALDGFEYYIATSSGGITVVDLIPHKSWYHKYHVIVPPGYTLYFYEEDHEGSGVFEDIFADDMPILVDSDGYIVK